MRYNETVVFSCVWATIAIFVVSFFASVPACTINETNAKTMQFQAVMKAGKCLVKSEHEGGLIEVRECR